MTWIDDFYLSSNITEDRRAIKRRICRHKDILEFYLLAVSSKNDGTVDIIPALELKSWPQRKKDNMVIVGVSSGYHNAKQLAERVGDVSLGNTFNHKKLF